MSVYFRRIVKAMELNSIVTSGGIISYSAGSSSLDPYSFRIVEDGTSKIQAAIKLFPILSKYFQKTPVVINCYPATLGSFNSVIYLDTYLRPVNFSRGLALAKELETACIILGQPLTVLDLLFKHAFAKTELPMPNQILFALGGYIVPASLESAFSHICKKSGVEYNLLHAYGMAEVNFGCLLGTHRDENGQVHYKIANEDVKVKLSGEQLFLGKTGSDSIYNTGDFARWVDELLIISPGKHRLNQEVIDNLERWDYSDWKKRTGYVGRLEGKLLFQLREDEIPNNDTEIEFFDFCRQFKTSWAAKPNWSI